MDLKMTLICGIDEAGRGPVIGSMVMVGVLIEEADIPKLKSLGVKDSKLLTKKKREELFSKIIKTAKAHKIIIIPPKEIDDALFSDDLNLNWLEAHKTAEIINELKPDKIIVDSPSNNCQAYTIYLKKLLHNPKSLQLICIHKADVKHPEVSAASILAKVTRDKEMEIIQKKYGNTGPGYMSNETTQKFLKENWEKHPEIFRHSWVSYKNHKQAKFQKTLADFDKFLEKESLKSKISNYYESKIRNKTPAFKQITKEDLEELRTYGYRFIPAKTEHETARMKGACTITLYKTGKLLIQGKPENKEFIERLFFMQRKTNPEER